MGVFAGLGAALAAAAALVEGAGGAVPGLAGPGVPAGLAARAAAVWDEEQYERSREDTENSGA